ncbi:MAG: hypothetical protein WC815_18835 [Vicinamibacterales bacterium]|jgi:hypothetical protein
MAAVITMGLGIGANTAMFTTLNAIVLKRSPITCPDELMGIAPVNSSRLDRVAALRH